MGLLIAVDDRPGRRRNALFVQRGDVVPLGAVVGCAGCGRGSPGKARRPDADAQATVTQNLFVASDGLFGCDLKFLLELVQQFGERILLGQLPQPSI